MLLMTNINCYFDSGIMPHSVIEKSVILERSLINRIFEVREAIWLKIFTQRREKLSVCTGRL